jgi:sugar lactone lactonase YvrE
MSSTRRTNLATLLTLAATGVMATGLWLTAPTATAHGGHGGGDHGGEPATHIPLPDGFRPEGITTGRHHTAYLGSLADGDIYALDLRSGEGEVISEGPGTPSVGLKLKHDLLFVSGGSAGNARVVGVRTGKILATYTLAPAPAFINDVVLTDDAAWFTDSLDNALYRIPLGGHGHHSLPSQADVEKVDLTGAWVQNAGNNANGITTTPDRRALLVINSSNGLLYRVDDDGVATQVDLGGYVVTNGDGLLREGRTLYAVQNRLNKVAVFKLSKSGTSGELRDTLTSPDFDVPTTIARSGGDLYLPNARFTTPPTPTTEYWVTGIDG